MKSEYDIIVVGAGHAGCEAASAAAKMGSSVLLITMDMRNIAQMSCNPAIGGIAKGQIVREIDALGGFSGIVTDASTIQFRMLNKSKGPAMWSPRAQCDKLYYTLNWRYILENTCKLDIWQDVVTSLDIRESKICGISTQLGSFFKCKAVIITAGTFLNGKIFIGQESAEGGRVGELSSYGIGEQLASYGISVARMKTGTPPRVDARSVNLSSLIVQKGDENPAKFSFLPNTSAISSGHPQKDCYIVHTNQRVHEILQSGFDRSPLFTGKIKGIGPRYCPSIEDKLRTFAGKDSHQLFLEPEGWFTHEYYLQGFSSSLPLDVQMDALHQIEGFENLKVFRPAYAVEYDFFDPTQLKATLESKVIENLFLAGQVNGTTGYEEAAAQGLMAGINASLKLSLKDPFILKRDEAYIGVLIDDLITKGVDEPYRMFTSRAEYRILLRQDNADFRLTEKAFSIGLASESRYKLMCAKYDSIQKYQDLLDSTSLKADVINPYLQSLGSATVDSRKRISDILTRPNVQLTEFNNAVPRGTFPDAKPIIEEYMANLSFDDLSLPYEAPIENFEENVPRGTNMASMRDEIEKEVVESVEVAIKYQGYIERERRLADKMLRLENIKIPDNFDFSKVSSLSIECRIKLERYRPRTIAQASRISGVSPADISVLLVYFGR